MSAPENADTAFDGATEANTPDAASARSLASMDYHERREARSSEFDTLYGGWLKLLAVGAREEDLTGADKLARYCDEIDDAARSVCLMPAPLPRQVFNKLHVIEHGIWENDHTGPATDKRLTVMLAALRADLMYFGWNNQAHQYS